jgi:DAACS family dicarboxylate/amino acid:cation (Na+ or H+) symporter
MGGSMTESHDPPLDSSSRRRWPLHIKILIGLMVGVTVGLSLNALTAAGVTDRVLKSVGATGTTGRELLDFAALQIADPLGRIFLRLILMVVIPLVLSALALGVLELGDLRRLGAIGLRTLGLTLLLSGCAVALGLGLVNWWQPGKTLSEEKREQLKQQYATQAKEAVAKADKAKPLTKTLLDIIPENPLQEMVGALDGSSPGNGMLAVMFFALALGIALSRAGPRGETLVRLLEGLFDVSMVIIGFAMRLAPYAVACLLFAITARLGADILQSLAWFMVTALVGMAIHLLLVYSLVVWALGGRSPRRFFADISEAMLTAFVTSSSNATLPTTLRVADQRLRLPKDIAQFVLTIGSTGNQNGTALYEGVVVLFLAQLFGVELTLGQQVTVVLMSVLAGVGTAGVPGGSIPLIVIVLKSVGVPGEGIGIILGVDRVLDMCRTVLNVSGDLVLAACVAGKKALPQATESSGAAI